MNSLRLLLSRAFLACALAVSAAVVYAQSETVAYRDAVLKDWALQERDAGRELGTLEALKALVERAELFMANATDSERDDRDLEALRRALVKARDLIERADEPAANVGDAFLRYLELRAELRRVALDAAEVSKRPILFLKEERFTWQMLHEFLSYYYNECGMRGGGLYLLNAPGRSFETTALTDGKFPRGVFQTPSLSYDAKSVYFSFADFSKTQAPDAQKTNVEALMQRPYVEDFDRNYMSISDGKFHLYKMSLEDGSFERLTDGSDDDFDPCETPDGELVFVSTRRGGYGRCHGHYEPLNVHTLHKLRRDKSVETLSFHETNEWQPSVMNDGRIVYTRWDYVDRAASRHHGLWTTNPDGTNAAILFGNYTFDVNACYQAKAIPNSNKIMFVGGAHHLDVGGSLLLFDPAKARYDSETGKDDLSSIEFLTPDVPLPETDSAPNLVCPRYYFSPHPLSEDAWIVSYSRQPLGGYLAGTKACGKTGIYYGDRWGNLELLYQNDDSEESCLHPIPLVERERPAVIPSALPKHPDSDRGTFVLSNVRESLLPLPNDRKIKELRIVQLLPKAPDYQSDRPKIGAPNAMNARMVLGTVPVEEDGSAHFNAPARVPLYFQAIDEEGRAVQSMRSIVYLQPGETRGCVGCHEQAQTIQTNDPGKRALASLREPSNPTPADDDLKPFSYPRFIQPILDRRCVECHNGDESASAPNLCGDPSERFTVSYDALVPYLRYYEWGGATHREIATFPGECGADISPLSKILDDETHKSVALTEQERRDLYLWMDINVPFYGTYEPDAQAAQLRGEAVEPPKLQ